MFDINNQADLTALKTEVETDPLAIGYNTADISVLLDQLNNPANNPGGEIGADFCTAKRMLKAIFNEPISSQDQFKVQLVFETSSGPDSDVTDYKANIAGLSAGLSAIMAGITRPLSRAEVLFADDINADPVEYVILTRNDWFAARDRG